MSEDYTVDERLEDVIVGYASDYLRSFREVLWPDVVEALARHDAEVKAAALRAAADHLDSLAQGGTAYNAAARDVRHLAHYFEKESGL